MGEGEDCRCCSRLLLETSGSSSAEDDDDDDDGNCNGNSGDKSHRERTDAYTFVGSILVALQM